MTSRLDGETNGGRSEENCQLLKGTYANETIIKFGSKTCNLQNGKLLPSSRRMKIKTFLSATFPDKINKLNGGTDVRNSSSPSFALSSSRTPIGSFNTSLGDIDRFFTNFTSARKLESIGKKLLVLGSKRRGRSRERKKNRLWHKKYHQASILDLPSFFLSSSIQNDNPLHPQTQ